MDEDFENLSASSSDEWAILDDCPANNLVIIDDDPTCITEKECSICGAELDQLVYKNKYCKLCPVCYACHQKYQGHPGLLRCQHHDIQVSGMEESYEIECESHPGSNDSLQSEPFVLNCLSASDFCELSQNVYQAKLDKMSPENGQPDATVEKKFSVLHCVQQSFPDVEHSTSRPLQIPAAGMQRSMVSMTDSSSHRYSLSSTDGEADIGCGTGTSLERDTSTATAAAAPTSDLAAKLAAFEFAPSAICCTPKLVPALSCTASHTGHLTGSPPAGAGGGLGIISNITATFNSGTLRSSPPSPSSASSSVSNSSAVPSGSPMNSAAQFLKSVVMHSATALNNFDFLPMHPWDANQKDQPTTVSNPTTNAGTVSPSLPRSPLPRGQQSSPSATAVAADPWLPTSPHVWDEEQFRALVSPRPLPKSVYEASAYNFI